MRYPTEAKHGSEGYRNSGLSKERSDGLQADMRPANDWWPQEFDSLARRLRDAAARAPVNDPFPNYPDDLPFGDEEAWEREQRRQATRRWLDRLNSPKTVSSLLRSRNPFLIGFGLGVGIGLIVWAREGASDPDESVGPEGWNYLGAADWVDCAKQCPWMGPASYFNTFPAGCTSADCDQTNVPIPGVGFGTPWEAWADANNTINVYQATTTSNQSFGRLRTQFHPGVNVPDAGLEDSWEQVMLPNLVPGVGTVIRVDEGFPEDYPIHQFASVPRPKTRDEAVAEPGTQPSTKPDRRTTVPEVYPLPPFPPNFPFPVVVVPPGVIPPGSSPLPTVPPVQIIEVGSGGGGVTVIQSPGSAASQEPPPGKTRERKIQSKTKIAGVYVAVNIVTESLDFIDSIYEGIPKKYKDSRREFCAAHDYKCKLEKIWKYQNEIDFAVAWEAFVNNALEDMVFGLIGGQVAKANQAGGITTGTTRATQHEQGGEASLEMEGQDQTGPLPVLTYDPETGKWGLAWEIFGLASPTVYVPGVKA